MNWRIKILIKLILHHLPIDYYTWSKLGLFKLGAMDQLNYASKIFKLHAMRAYPEGIPPGLVFLGMGPGDSIASALLANAYGAKKVYLMDTGSYATRHIDVYKKIVKGIREEGLKTIDIEGVNDFYDILKACNTSYLTNGVSDFESIDDNSIDFIWSHSVLEHVRKRDFNKTIAECNRILKPSGFMSHNVDLMDHLGGQLNNLRFSEKMWENNYFANSGFYTNRLRFNEIEKIIKDADFDIKESEFSRWPELPTPKSAMDKSFKILSEDELLIRCCHYVAIKAH